MENITVNEFIDGLFPLDAAGEVCIAYRPAGGKFRHMRCAEGLGIDGETYVCVSTVQAAPRLRRRKSDCVRACVVLLDDVGTKVGIPPVPPTAILETSPDNFQYLYRLDPPENVAEGPEVYEAAVQHLADKGFTDPGSLGVSRVFRLPRSLNVKHSPAFSCELREWHEDRAWTLQSLLADFGLSLTVEARPEAPPAVTTGVLPDVDPVLTWLTEHGRIKGKRDEWHLVTCPWADTHTTGDKEAAFCPLGEGGQPYLRGFKCLHGHCIKRTATDFLAWVAENDGPQVGVTAPSEDVGKLLENISQLSLDERYRLIQASLPTISALNLPDSSVTAKGTASLTQLATSPNVMHLMGASGMRTRFNMQSRETEFWLNDNTLQEIVPNEHAVKRAIVDTCLRLGIANIKQVETILVERSLDDRYHPMQDWIRSKAWDGQPRLQQLLDSVDVEKGSEALWPLFLRKWFIQGVQAVCGWVRPKQMGSVLVFSGQQYRGKTLWFGSLVPEQFFTASGRLTLGFAYKDSVMSVTHTPVTELGELDSTFRKSDTGALKAFLTAESDTYRPPYGALTLRVPRTTIFCGTVNRLDFLVDETGSRRFWPVEITRCRPDHQVDMQQMWAEAYVWWKNNERWWLSVDESAQTQEHSEYYRVTSSVEETFTMYIDRTREQDPANYVALNLSTLMEQLQVPPLPQNVGTMRILVERQFGRRHRRARGVQNAWIVPDPFRAVEKLGDSDEKS